MTIKSTYDGVTRCTAKTKDECKECDNYQKHSYENRCRFLVRDTICDWNPDMACVKAVSNSGKTDTKWPSKEEMERRQTIIDSTDCGI